MDSNPDRSPKENRGRSIPTRRTLLRVGAGAIATAAALPILGGSAAAHFPEKLNIDVRPGQEENKLSTNSGGLVSVAVLRTEFTNSDGESVEFDPTEEDVRYRFGAPDVVSNGGGARPVHDGHARDVNGDCRDDLVLHFRMDEAGFDGDETTGKLLWERNESGEHGYSGTDEVTFVDTKSENRESTNGCRSDFEA